MSSIEEIDYKNGKNLDETSNVKEEDNEEKKENDLIIVCEKCSLKFKEKCYYEDHLKNVHSTEEDNSIKLEHESSTSFSSDTTKMKKNTIVNTTEEQVFKCKKCFKVFNEPIDFNNHLEIHVKRPTYYCEKCTKEFVDETSLKEHRLTDLECKVDEKTKEREKQDMLYCSICNRNFFYESALEKHKKLHLKKEASFTCSHCPQKFFQKTNLVQHEYTHTRPTYTCYICTKVFYKAYLLKNHIRLHGKSRLKLNCDQCGKSFKFKSSLEMHIQNHSKASRFKCKGCDAEFVHKTSFMRHMQIKINNSTKFRCEICGKICCHKKNFDNHLNTHLVEDFNKECKSCDHKFASKAELQKHRFTHVATTAQFYCDYCEAAFTDEKDLYRHKYTLSGSRWKCKTCNRTFMCARGLQRHYCNGNQLLRYKVATLDDNFIDAYAEELLEASSYKKTQNRSKHRDHTYALQSWPIKPYKCKKCGKHFCRLVNLEKHIQEIHPFYLSAESSEGNSEDEEMQNSKSLSQSMPKITLVTSMRIQNERVFVSDSGIQDLDSERDEELVDPLSIDYHSSQSGTDMEMSNTVGTRTNKTIVKIEPHSLAETQQSLTRVNELDVIDIKQEMIDYESS